VRVPPAEPSDSPLVRVHKRRFQSEDRYGWLPFTANDAFEHDHWWDHVSLFRDAFAYIEVRRGGIEVARVQLDDDLHGGDYVNLRGQNVLQVDLIEVATPYRRQGIATDVIGLLTDEYPDHRLAALSEDADDFWASLGWRRYDNRREPMSRPLYLQPPRRWRRPHQCQATRGGPGSGSAP
jgi:GNAT superfamily N-acetyltransferase